MPRSRRRSVAAPASLPIAPPPLKVLRRERFAPPSRDDTSSCAELSKNEPLRGDNPFMGSPEAEVDQGILQQLTPGGGAPMRSLPMERSFARQGWSSEACPSKREVLALCASLAPDTRLQVLLIAMLCNAQPWRHYGHYSVVLFFENETREVIESFATMLQECGPHAPVACVDSVHKAIAIGPRDWVRGAAQYPMHLLFHHGAQLRLSWDFSDAFGAIPRDALKAVLHLDLKVGRILGRLSPESAMSDLCPMDLDTPVLV